MFDQTQFKLMVAEMDLQMEIVATKYGLKYERRSGKLSRNVNDNSNIVEVKFSNITFQEIPPLNKKNGVTAKLQTSAKEQSDYIRDCIIHNLSADWLGKSVVINGTKYTIAGMNPRRSKNCVIITNESNGKNYICSPASVIRAKSTIK